MQRWAWQAGKSRGDAPFCSSREHFVCPFPQTRLWAARQHRTARHPSPSSTPKCVSVRRGDQTKPERVSEAGRTGRRFPRCHRVADSCSRASVVKSPPAATVVQSEVYRVGKGRTVDPHKAAPSSPSSASRSGVDGPFAFKIHKDKSFDWKEVKERDLTKLF